MEIKNSNTQKEKEKTESEYDRRPKIFISGLTYNMEKNPTKFLNTLKEHIDGAEDIEMLKNKDEDLPGFAIIYLSDFKYLKKAIKLKKVNLEKNKIVVIKPFKTGKQLQSYLKDKKKRTVYINKIANKYNSEDLLKTFQPFGKVEQAIIYVRKKDGSSRGFGKVIFRKKETVLEVTKDDFVRLWDGKKCFVSSEKPPKVEKKENFLEDKKEGLIDLLNKDVFLGGGIRILEDLDVNKMQKVNNMKEEDQIFEEKILDFLGKNKTIIKEKFNTITNTEEKRTTRTNLFLDHEFKPTNWRYYSPRVMIWVERDDWLNGRKYRFNWGSSL